MYWPVAKEISFKNIYIFSSGDNGNYGMLAETEKNIVISLACKYFFTRALVAILFSRVEPFVQFW